MDTHQTSIFAAILIACIVVAVVLGYFIVVLIRHSRRNIRLYKEMLVAEIITLEKERKRIASDLHDELGPIIAGIKLMLNSLEVADPDDQAMLQKVHGNLADIIYRMKEISNDLMPMILMKKGLLEAMEATTQELDQTAGFSIRFSHSKIPVLSEAFAINIYRILLEIIHNTVKHAKASELYIRLRFDRNVLKVETQDNGTGFNYKLIQSERLGRGLQNLVNRTEVLGGLMYIDAAPGKGTKYVFEFPLNE